MFSLGFALIDIKRAFETFIVFIFIMSDTDIDAFMQEFGYVMDGNDALEKAPRPYREVEYEKPTVEQRIQRKQNAPGQKKKHRTANEKSVSFVQCYQYVFSMQPNT